jgi:hypothetical protein
MTVKGGGKGFSAYSEKLSAVLEFGQDNRNAWVCVGLINMNGIINMSC